MDRFRWTLLLGCLCRLLIAILGGVSPAPAWDKGSLSDYHERRVRLVRQTGAAAIVLFGYGEADIAASTTTFRQNENFYYLTGWNEPDAMMLLVPAASKGEEPGGLEKEILFLP